MNIFATYPCPRESALSLDDIRVSKLITESAQMLSDAVRTHAGTRKVSDTIMKGSYHNHPCTKWARENRSNFFWLCMHGANLLSIYRMNGGTKHLRAEEIFGLCAKKYQEYVPKGKPTPFARAFAASKIGEAEYQRLQSLPCPHDAYRQYLSMRWDMDTINLSWKGRAKPNFYSNKKAA